MGREIRRVPLDFDWPLHKLWRGFENPHYRECPGSEGDACVAGYSAAGKWFNSIVSLIQLIGDEAVERTPEHSCVRNSDPHPYLTEWPQAPRHDLPYAERVKIRALDDRAERRRALDDALRRFPPRVLPLTGELAGLVRGLAGNEKRGFGPRLHFSDHAIDEALRRAAGLDENWGVCMICNGSGIDPAVCEAYDAWEEEDPPVGEGWQLWETVTEGSPVSPVLPTREAFVDWLVKSGQTRKAAEAFTAEGWCPSGMIVDGKVYEGIESVGIKDDSP